MKKQNEEKKFGFITFGIYKNLSLKNDFYNIDDFIPVLVNNKPKLLGEGRFSKVFLYKNKNTDSLYALKKISINKIIESGNNLNIIKREINIHSKIIHENIVRFYSVKENINEIYLLLEYCNNGSIYELISKNGFNEYKTYTYFRQVVNAIYFLHKNNLVHRDIKPENILLNYDKIKLCDFGWCCEANTNNRTSFCGTFEYMAPEIINEIPYGKPVDIWALGILLFEFYYGFSPFSSELSKDIINNILNKRLIFPKWKTISNDMKDLIINMLNSNVSERYTIEQVVAHPWFKKCEDEFKNNIKADIPNNEMSNIKITKIIKNKHDLIYNSNIRKEAYITNNYNLDNGEKEKYNNHSNIYKKQNNLKKSNVIVKKLINIDINVNEDDSSSIKSRDSNEIKESYDTGTNFNKIIEYQNKEDIRYKKEKSDNYFEFKNEKENQKGYQNIKSNLVELNNNQDFLKKNNTIINEKSNYLSFFPMDSILEETNNDSSDAKSIFLPKYASVIKLESNQNINNNEKSLYNMPMNNMGQTSNDKTIINNYFLNNNYYTINYYSNINDNDEYQINYNNNIDYQFLVPYYQTNVYK